VTSAEHAHLDRRHAERRNSERRDSERRDSAEPRDRILRDAPWRAVAVVSAVALGAVGAAAAPRLDVPVLVGAAVGGLVALLAVLALPSLPSRPVAVVLLGIAGLAALRHAALPATDSTLIVLWAGATLLALVLIDRAQAEHTPELTGGRKLGPRLPEAIRVATLIGVVVVAVSVVVVPVLTDQLSRHSWPGTVPSLGNDLAAPGSLRSSSRLDMTTRPRLSDRVVFTVDAPRPDFWRGEVYDVWDTQAWTRSPDDPQALQRSDGRWQLLIDPFDDGALHGQEMQQTFTIETDFTELVFAAPSAVQVQTDRFVYGRPDGTAVVRGGFGSGAIYTVTSRSSLPTAEDLRAAAARPVPAAVVDRYTRLPRISRRVRALAERITAGQRTAYDKVRAIEQWLSQNTRYSLDAPLSPKGVDVVDHFLFTSRLGWCEQVASSLTVMARSVGIPARLATGFVPGEKDGLSGRFVVRERDAHAWTEIYFPGVGWQGFDPTASVPLAGEAPRAGSWLEDARRHATQFAVVLALLVALVTAVPRLRAGVRHRLARRASWAIHAQDRIERVGRRAGHPRRPSETPREYARRLATSTGDDRLATVGDVIDEDLFASEGARPAARAAADTVLAEQPRRRHDTQRPITHRDTPEVLRSPEP
jgi:transglutaminase-like putative cysteine protease